MNFKIKITEKGKTINYRGTPVRTPTEVILNEQETELLLSQLRQLSIGQFTIEKYIPEKKAVVLKEQPNNEKVEPTVEELADPLPPTLLEKLASEK
jgi:hypothetical protein